MITFSPISMRRSTVDDAMLDRGAKVDAKASNSREFLFLVDITPLSVMHELLMHGGPNRPPGHGLGVGG